MMLDPVDYWAATSGLGSAKSSNFYQPFSSSSARGYGKNFGNNSMLGSNFGLDQGFMPYKSATKSAIDSILADRQAEADFAVNALGALTNMKIADMRQEQMEEAQSAGGGGSAPKRESLGSSLLKTGVGAAVSAGVGALI